MAKVSKVKVLLNKQKVIARLRGLCDEGTTLMATEFLKDANEYCREDSSVLRKSAIIHSRPEKGEIIWDTPYAREVYYKGFPSHNKNPKASLLWGHRAAMENRNKYMKILSEAIRGKDK